MTVDRRRREQIDWAQTLRRARVSGSVASVVSGVALAGVATAVSALAMVVDYRATPKRFTPGWEFVLTKPLMCAVYGAMAAYLVLGARLTAPSR